MGQLTGYFSPIDDWWRVPSHVTWGKSEVAAFNSVMRPRVERNSRMNCKNATKKLTFFLIEHLNGNMNLVVGISVMTFEHIFINLIL